MTARTIDRKITDAIIGRAGGFRHNRSSNYFLSTVARGCFSDWAREEGLAGWEELVDIKTSRSPQMLASYFMSEIGAAEASPAIMFVQALVGVAAGDEIRAGMICRFIGWEWRPYFMARKPGNLWRVGGREHAVRKHDKELGQGMGELGAELRAYHEHFEAVVGRPSGPREPPPEWLAEFVAIRIGGGVQQGLVLDIG